MEFSYDRWNQLEDIELVLCNPNRDKIGVISALDRQVTERLNDLAELKFEVPRYAANARGEVSESPYYDWIQTMRLIYAEQIGWFVITKVEESDAEDGSITKSVSCESHQTIFKNFGFVTEERVYKFYDPSLPYDSTYDSTDIGAIPSVVGQLYQQLGIDIKLSEADVEPEEDYDNWTLTYVTPGLYYYEAGSANCPKDWENICRTLTDNTTNGYDFMLNDIEDAFEIIFDFDYLHHAIKVKTVEEITKKTNIYLSKDNILNTIDVTEDASDVATVLSCEGDSLDITLVNPMGTNYIVNFDYYMQTATDKNGHEYYPWMSKQLQTALNEWKQVFEANKEPYQELVLKLRDLYEEQLYKEERLTYLKTKLTDVQAVLDQKNDPDTELQGDEIFTAEELMEGEYSIYPKSLFYTKPFYTNYVDENNENNAADTREWHREFYDCDVLEDDEEVEELENLADDVLDSGVTYERGGLTTDDFILTVDSGLDQDNATVLFKYYVEPKDASKIEYTTKVTVELGYWEHNASITKEESMEKGSVYRDVFVFDLDHAEKQPSSFSVRGSGAIVSQKIASVVEDIPEEDEEEEETTDTRVPEEKGTFNLSGNHEYLQFNETVNPATGDIKHPFFIDCNEYVLIEEVEANLVDNLITLEAEDESTYPFLKAGYTVSAESTNGIIALVPAADSIVGSTLVATTLSDNCTLSVSRSTTGSIVTAVTPTSVKPMAELVVADEGLGTSFAVVTVQYAYTTVSGERAIRSVDLTIPEGTSLDSATLTRQWNLATRNTLENASGSFDFTYSPMISKVVRYEYQLSEDVSPDSGPTYCKLFSKVQSVEESDADLDQYEVVYSIEPQLDENGNQMTDVFGTDNVPYYLYQLVVTIRAIDDTNWKDYDLLFTYRCAVNTYTIEGGEPTETLRTFTESAFLPAPDPSKIEADEDGNKHIKEQYLEGDEPYEYKPEVTVTITGLVGLVPATSKDEEDYPTVDWDELGSVVTTVYQLSGFDRYASYNDAYYWMGLYNDEIAKVTAEYDDIQAVIDEVNTELETIANQTAILSYFKQNYNYLIPELKAYWKESTYTNDNLAVLDTTTMAEQIDLANQLMEAGEDELSLISQPRFSFTAEGINFIFLPEFRPFAKEVEMGCVVTVEKEEGVFYYPALSQVEFSLDDFSSFSMTFTNRARLDDFGYTIADLISSSSSTSNTINNNWSNLMKYVNQEEELKSIITNPLEETFTMATNNAVLQEFTINERGIWGRKYTDDTKSTFAKEQLRMTNNILMFTDDDWASIRTAIGKVSVEGNEYYGLIGQAVVGDLIFGQQLNITNDKNTITMNSNGLTIYDNADNAVFYADNDGNLVLTGTLTANSKIQGATITGANIYECVIDENSTFSGDFSGTIVNSDGNTLAYIEDGKMVLTEGTSLMGTKIVDSNGNEAGYIGDDGTAYILVAAQEGSSITGATIEQCVIDSNSTFSGDIIDNDGTVIATIVDGKLSADLSEDSELSGQIVKYDENGNSEVVGWIKDGQLWAIITDSTIESSSIIGSTVEETKVYESSVSLDEYGLTILNSGGITIYSSEYQDARDAVFKEVTKSDGTKERVLYDKDDNEIDPVFYADEKGNLVLKGVIYASDGEFTGKITANSGQIGGFTITGNSLKKDKSAYDDSNNGVYLGIDGIGLGKISNPEINEPDNIGESYSGFFVTADGALWSRNSTFYNATIEGTGTFNSLEVGSINCVASGDDDDNSGSINVDEISVKAITFANSGAVFQSTSKEGGDNTMTATVSCNNGSGYSFTCTVELTDQNKKAYTTEYDRTFSITFVSNNGKKLGYSSITVEKGKSTSGDVGLKSTKIFGAGYQFPSDWYFSNSTSKSKTLTYNLDATSINVSGSLVPSEDNVYDLGSSTAAWKYAWFEGFGGKEVNAENLAVEGLSYAGDGVWSASDEKIKESVEQIPDSYSAFFDKLNPVRYKRIDGTSGRFHTGLIAQDVLKAINESGLSTDDLAAYIENEDLSLCGLRYDEFIALLIKEVQNLKREIKILKEQ